MIKAIKTFFDSTDFDEVGDSMDLWWATIQDAFDFDALKDKTIFLAKVITPPVPLTAEAVKNMLPIESDPKSDVITKKIFKARILGNLSHHRFWPDPCDPRFVEEVGGEEAAMEWILKHTDVIATSDKGNVNVGDTVRIQLEPNIFTVGCGQANLVEVVQSLDSIDDVKLKELASGECATPLSELFNNFVPVVSAATAAGSLTLQAAYNELYAEIRPPARTAQDIYDYLFEAFGKYSKFNNLILGMLANIAAESARTYNPGIISGAPGESSIGLFQMNVGGVGRRGPPTTAMGTQFNTARISPALRLDDTASVVPYFAGALFLREKGESVPDPATFSGNKDELRSGYKAFLANKGEDQLDFAVEEVARMLTSLGISDPNKYSVLDWSNWFQIYFEQPAVVKTRIAPKVKLSK
jgi:hypothetical protein